MPVKPHFASSSQCALSGAGGSVCAARTSYSCVRRRSSIDSRNWRSGLASSGASAASLRSSSISSCDSSSALRPTFAALPSDRNDTRDDSANGPSSVNVSSRSGAAFCRSRRSGVCSSVSLPSSAIVGFSSSRNVGKSSNCRASSARRVALISAVSPASTTQRATSLLLLLELRDHAVRVGDEVLDDLVLVAEDLEHLARLAQAGMGALEDLLEVLRPAGEARAELGEDQPEPLAVRPPHDVAEQVLRHDR